MRKTQKILNQVQDDSWKKISSSGQTSLGRQIKTYRYKKKILVPPKAGRPGQNDKIKMKFNNLKSQALQHWPILAYIFIVLVLFATNYRANTFLTGWDNLHPEFNFWVNIKRSFFSVWQNDSLGLIIGHTSDFVHQFILLLLSAVFPMSILRYIWTFLMLTLGPIGAYFLMLFILRSSSTQHEMSNVKYQISNTSHVGHWTLDIGHSKATAFVGGLFYLLNLATIQTFYAPFEAFIGHYAALPWFLFASLLYLKKQTLKSLIILSLILFLSTPSAYIPTLFVTIMIALSIICVTHLILSPSKRVLLSIIKLYSVIIIINAFWLFPFIFFTLTQPNVNINSKINQMATEIIFSQNKEFGDLSSVILLKGFWFNNVDPNFKGVFTYMMPAWRAWTSFPPITLLGYLLFGVVLTGFIKSFFQMSKKNTFLTGFSVVFLFSITALAISTPPFSLINSLIRDHVQILHQAFRFPFTKFSILAALSYAIFFSFGVKIISEKLYRFSPNKLLRIRNHELGIREIFSLILIPASLFIFLFPAFFGHLLYEKERIAIPKEYFQVFDFFNRQDKASRIANFPQHTFWGWNFTKWGYGGSGFLWYGVPQGVVDRAYDVWSETSENYYFEVSRALYAKDASQFENVLQKYKIKWLLIDHNVINPPSYKALFTEELKTIIKSSPRFKKVKTFGNIDIYSLELKDKPQNFMFLNNPLPTVNSYSSGDYDRAYETVGNYISTDKASASYYFPFRSLFSKKIQPASPFSLKKTPSSLVASSTLPPSEKERTILVPSTSEDLFIPTQISTQKKNDGTLLIQAKLLFPSFTLSKKQLYAQERILTLFIIPKGGAFPYVLDINGVKKYNLDNQERIVGTTFLTIKQDNYIVISGKNKASQTQTITAKNLEQLVPPETAITLPPSKNSQELKITLPLINDSYLSFEMKPSKDINTSRCDRFREGQIDSFLAREKNTIVNTLSAKNTTSCTVFYSSSLLHNAAYVAFINTKNVEGKGFHFWILNEDEQFAPITEFLPANKKEGISQFIIPPMEDFGRSYSFHFENIAIGNEEVKNVFIKGEVYPIPYRFLTSLVIKDTENFQPKNDYKLYTQYYNDSLFSARIKAHNNDLTLTLSQAYNPFWKAYSVKHTDTLSLMFPFLFGTEIKEHVKINNWENGWIIKKADTDSSIILVYLPQYLEYSGILIGILFIGSMGINITRQKSRTTTSHDTYSFKNNC